MHPPHIVAAGLADAALAGPATPRSVRTRCESALGASPGWLRGLGQTLSRRFSPRWDDRARAAIAEVVLHWPGFLEAFASAHPPTLRRHFLRPRQMLPLPDALHGHCVPDLPTAGDVADWLGLHAHELDWFAGLRGGERRTQSEPLRHYSYRPVPKQAGGVRLLEIPKPWLRHIQQRILHELLEHIPPHEAVHGFRRAHSALTNARQHVGQHVVMRMDLADFFVSLRAGRVRALFATLGYPAGAAHALTGLCTNRVPRHVLDSMRPDLSDLTAMRRFHLQRMQLQSPHLPQGAPTSPALANLCAFNLDLRLAAVAEAFEARYTRYSDDVTFSGGTRLAGATLELCGAVRAIVEDEGLSVNMRKTRCMSRASRQQVTGIVVNRHTNVARPEYDRLKAILHNCARYGPAAQNRDGVPDFRAHLLGHIAFVRAVNARRAARLQRMFERIRWED